MTENSFVKASKFKSYYIISWTIAVLLWIYIILIILEILLLNNKTVPLFSILPLFITFYIFYLIAQCKCSYNYCFSKIITPEQMMLMFINLVKEKPTIGFNCFTNQRLLSNFKYQREFPYYTFRDISGLLNLNYDNSKNFIFILEINKEMIFCDDKTEQDFENFKFQCEKEEKSKDFRVILIEYKYTGNFTMIVEFGKCCQYNCYLFVVLSLLTVAHIYRQITDGPYERQKITIKKVISSRNNLYEPKYEQIYNNSNPMVNINNKLIKFDNYIYNINPNYINQNYNNYNLQIPGNGLIKRNIVSGIQNYNYYPNNQEISVLRRNLMGEIQNNSNTNNNIHSEETLNNLNIDNEPEYIEVNIKGNQFINNNFDKNKEINIFKDNTRNDSYSNKNMNIYQNKNNYN